MQEKMSKTNGDCDEILANISNMSQKLFEYVNATINDIDLLENVFLEIASAYIIGAIDFSKHDEENIKRQLANNLNIITDKCIEKSFVIFMGEQPENAKMYRSKKFKVVDEEE